MSSWWHETVQLYVRYLIAVLSGLPAAAIYAYLATNNLNRWQFEAILLVLGLALATAGWRMSARLFAQRVLRPEGVVSAGTALVGPPAPAITAWGTIRVAVVCVAVSVGAQARPINAIHPEGISAPRGPSYAFQL